MSKLVPKPYRHYKDKQGRLWLLISMYGMYEHMDPEKKDEVILIEVKYYPPGTTMVERPIKEEQFIRYLEKGTLKEVVPVIPK